MSELRVGFVGLGAMGEPGIDARCVEAHLAPANARSGTRRAGLLGERTMREPSNAVRPQRGR